MKKITNFIVAMLLATTTFAQVKVGDNPTTINSSAVLEVESTTKGFLPPRMTTAQRDAITSPAEGLTIYNTDINCMQWYVGGNIWHNACGGNTYLEYPAGTVFCGDIVTEIVDVVSATNVTWMDRNLGATRAATSSTDNLSYGSLYQWGRASDGHQCVDRSDGVTTSVTTTTLATTDQPAHGDFILTSSSPHDWRSDNNNNRWNVTPPAAQPNNPCPTGYRVPTDAELSAEDLIFTTQNAAGAFGSALKLPTAGLRHYNNGSLTSVGVNGLYWSSGVGGANARFLDFGSGNSNVYNSFRTYGRSVRCVKD